MNVFKAIPFVRILIPFAAGILFAVYGEMHRDFFYLLCGAAVFLSSFFLLGRKVQARLLSKSFIVFTDVFLFLGGIHCCYNYDIRNSEKFYAHLIPTGDKTEWLGEIREPPVEKGKTFKSKVKIIAVKKGGEFVSAEGSVLVYFKKPFNPARIMPGNLFMFNSDFSEVKSPQNPGEFNYRQFLSDKNIFHVCFVDSAKAFFTGQKSGSSLMGYGLKVRQDIIDSFRDQALGKEAGNFCSALLTGHDDEISAETINAFAHSGTLHVLSVSGWHTGILYIVLVFVFNLFDPHNRFKWIRVLVLISALFCFTLITGFSAPVLRAAIMLSLLSIGKFWFNYSSENSLNILAVSAFLILFFDPLLIRNAGFLLSYSAIIGIVCIEPWMTGLIEIENTFLKRIWQLSCVSVSAQISTLPVTLVLFHQFPVWFIFSNLIIIPLCSVLIYLGILFLLKLKFLAPLINMLVGFILFLVGLTDNANWGYIDKIDFSVSDSLLLCLLLILTAIFIKMRTFSSLAQVLFLIIVWQAFSLIEVTEKKSATFLNLYSVNRHSAFDLKTGNLTRYCSDVTLSDYNYHIRPNQTAYNYPGIFEQRMDYIKSGRISLFYLKKESHLAVMRFLEPEYLVVSNDIEVPALPTRTKMLIADGSNTFRHIKYLKHLCDEFGIKFYSVKEKGYLTLTP